ncbi:MAG: MBOAT family protein [Lachnospiraceae bacterium]|nr:MBOAT family protein [Lachnospiraceae bacterium]
MVFSSLEFIFRFLPIFLIVYYLVPAEVKNPVLFIGSMIFYSFGEPRFAVLVVLSIIVNYCCAYLMEKHGEENILRKRMFFIVALLYDIGALVVFKYLDFIVGNINAVFGTSITEPSITLPLGISFYTFQIMSYVIDVYRGRCKVERNILNLGTYLIMFPQLIAGPIVLYDTVSYELRKRKVSLLGLERGLKKFTLGLGMKVIFANNIGNIWNACEEAGYANISTPMAWLGILSFSLQLYYDFGGYSLMAIGLGEMLGFNFPKNFDFPYIANSVTDFWKRWHMTLTGWFREYIYIPLGGNRKGKARMFLNMLIVWLITGLWHGAAWNFVIWGLYYFVLLSVERLFLKKLLDKSKVLSRIYTLIAVMCGWVLFQTSSLTGAVEYLSRMFTYNPGWDFLEVFKTYSWFLIPGIICATPVFVRPYRKYRDRLTGIVILFLIFWGSVVLLVDSVYNPFLYFRF